MTERGGPFPGREPWRRGSRSLRRSGAESRRGFGSPTALPQVFVDDQDALTRPAEGYRLVGQSILPRCGLTMFRDLCRRRLPHIDDGELFQVLWANLGT